MSKNKKPPAEEEKRGPGRPRTLPAFNPAVPEAYQRGGPLESLLSKAAQCVAVTKDNDPARGWYWLGLANASIHSLQRQQIMSGLNRKFTPDELYAIAWARHHGKWNLEQ